VQIDGSRTIMVLLPLRIYTAPDGECCATDAQGLIAVQALHTDHVKKRLCLTFYTSPDTDMAVSEPADDKTCRARCAWLAAHTRLVSTPVHSHVKVQIIP
jgi:hypothetical protein